MRRAGYKREYYLKNREKFLETSRKWREENKERNNAYQRAYYHKNKEAITLEKELRRINSV